MTTWLTYLAAVAEYDRFQDAARKQFLGARKQSHFISTEHKCLANAMPRCPESRNKKSASAMPRCHSISTEHKCLDFNPRSRVSSFNTYQYASRCATTSEYTRLQCQYSLLFHRCMMYYVVLRIHTQKWCCHAKRTSTHYRQALMPVSRQHRTIQWTSMPRSAIRSKYWSRTSLPTTCRKLSDVNFRSRVPCRSRSCWARS